MPSFQAIIEGVPVAKGRPRMSSFGGFARAYTPAKTRHAEEDLAFAVKGLWGKEPLSVPLRVNIVFTFCHPKSASKKDRLDTRHIKRPDADNLAKTVLDSLNGVLWSDDSIIWQMSISKRYGASPSTSIAVEWAVDASK